MDIQQIESQIRRIAKTGGVALSRHCRQERMPERNVDFQDILNVLNWGKVVHDPILLPLGLRQKAKRV